MDTTTPQLFRYHQPTPTESGMSTISFEDELSDDIMFDHIVHKILMIHPTSDNDIKQWMEHYQIKNIMEMLNICVHDTQLFDDMVSYVNKDGGTSKIINHVLARLKLIAKWASEWVDNHHGEPPQKHDLFRLSQQELNRWRITLHESNNPVSPLSNTTPRSTKSSHSTSSISLAEQAYKDFKKATKRDATVYDVFKDESYYDSWYRSFQVTAKSQGLENILNENYIPSPADQFEQMLYKEQQVFVYSVLLKVIQTDQGRLYVREHENDHNATKVLQKLHHHHTKSEIAKQSVIKLTSYITNMKLTDDWKYTTRQFLLHFKDKFRALDALSSIEERMPDITRLALLTHAVENVPDLRRVRIVDSVFRAKSGATKNLGYEEYFALLMDAAFHLDHAVETRGKRRNILMHEHTIPQSDTPSIEHDNEVSNDEDNIQQEDHNTMINLTKQKKGNQKPSPQGNNTPGKVHVSAEIWKTLPDDVKSVIINHNRSTNPKPIQESSNEIQINECQTTEQHPETVQKEESEVDQDPMFTMIHNMVVGKGGDKPTTANNTSPTNSDKMETERTNKTQIEMNRYFHTHQRYIQAVNNKSPYQLLDRGANGGLVGADMKIIHKTGRKTNIIGIDNHELNGLDIVTAATMLPTNKGVIIGIFHEYAYYGKGKSIHSPGQMEWFKVKIDDKSVKIGGKQTIETLDGYTIPLIIREGLVYIQSLGIPNEKDMERFPHVIFTSPREWDPSKLDYKYPTHHIPENQNADINRYHGETIFDEYGEFIPRVVTNLNILLDQPLNQRDTRTLNINTQHHSNEVKTNMMKSNTKDQDWEELRRFFAWTSTQHIKDTFKVSTRYAPTVPSHDYIKKHYKTRNPALNIPRRNEAVATDTIYSDTKSVCGGYDMAQIFVGRETLVCDIYGIKSTKQFVNTLADNIRQRGAMNTLISDSATYQISDKVKDILRSLFISDYQSEPYHQHQNKAEIRYATVKTWTKTVMNITGCPTSCWLLCMEYVCVILNYMSSPALNDISPMQKLTGITPDISFCMFFMFWEPVYFKVDNKEIYQKFPSLSNERKGNWVGFAQSIGDALTWKILTQDTKEIIYRSAVRSAKSSLPNMRIEKPKQEFETGIPNTPTIIIKSRTDETRPLFTIDVDEIVGKTYKIPCDQDNETQKITIIKKVEELDEQGKKLDSELKYLIRYNDKQNMEEIVSYSFLMEYLQKDTEQDPINRLYNFNNILAHQGPLTRGDKEYKGSLYNVIVEWETGDITAEPLSIIAQSDPVTCAAYAKQHNLLNTKGWQYLNKYVQMSKQLMNKAKTTKIRQVRTPIKYQFGVLVPRNYQEAIIFDTQNKNTKWQDAIDTELQQISDYNTFIDHGKAVYENNTVVNAPQDHQKIRVHLVFAVKHDGRHKARLVADGHLTPEPVDTVYSGVVSLRSLRIVIFLAELNKQTIWGADIGNAYLEAQTSEKLYIVAGPEFKELSGHILSIHKALYGLKTSGARWHDRLFDILREMEFHPSKADSDVWFRKDPCSQLYEYITTYVDDLTIAMKNPEDFIKELKEKYKLKIKGDGPIEYHLGCTYRRDPDGTLVADPKRYIDKLIETYEHTFGQKPKKSKPPLIAKDHPELDQSDLLDESGIKLYQSMIGQLQWIVSLGRFDISTAVMSISGYRAAPRQGHLDRAKRIFGYLYNLPDATIRFRTKEPDYSRMPIHEYDWSRTVYAGARESIPNDVPIPLGKQVILTTYVDANLCHDSVTGKSVTGILHLINQTPIDWYSKKQATVETATYGSEFVAARIAVDQIIDLRTTLRYLGVHVYAQSYMFGDNQSVITSSSVPTSPISKRHHLTCYHRVREAIAAGYIRFHWIESKTNPADILSKHWEFSTAWPLIKGLLFWRGTMNNIDGQDKGELYNSTQSGVN